MIAFLRRREFSRLLSLAGILLMTATASACPFCSMQGQTLTQELGQASMVLVGRLTNAQPSKNGSDLGDGTTDLIVTEVIKSNPILAKFKGQPVSLARYVPVLEKDSKTQYLIFCDVYKEKIDPYRGMPIPEKSDIVKYLQGALKLKDAKVGEKLRFFFDYLDNPDTEIANDAYKEFGNADYKEYSEMARSLPDEKVSAWLDLDKSKTPAFRVGLYGSLLGHCSKNPSKHAKQLRAMIEDSEKRNLSGIDGVMAGYVMLEPRGGWEFILGIIKNPDEPFSLRYAALRAVRFFMDLRPDVVEKKQLLVAMGHFLQQQDVADLAIEDLRKWKCWDMTDQILALRKKESHDVGIIRRAILRFALSDPNPAAKKYVAEQRKADAELVNETEEWLKYEQTAPAPAKPEKKTGIQTGKPSR